ncbi:MAG: SpoIID/LytB domain-containing protein [Planctomycetota bacterium]|nr:SpoIID/LytB domain-containing protein [Planctomycetota bacterium]
MRPYLLRSLIFVFYGLFLLTPLACTSGGHPFLVPLPESPIRDEPVIRVRVAVSAEPVIAKGSVYSVFDADGKLIAKNRAESEQTVKLSGKTLIVSGKTFGLRDASFADVHTNTSIFVNGAEIPFPVRIAKVNDTTVVLALVPFERYIAGVVSSEMPVSWPSEALKAQAVAARTYALCHMNLSARKPYDVTSTTAHQKFNASKPADSAIEAAKATRGEVLMYRSRLLMTFYHSTSGGSTANASSVFDCSDITPLTRVEMRSEQSPHTNWTHRMSWGAFNAKVLEPSGKGMSEPPEKVLVKRKGDGTVELVTFKGVNDVSMTGRDIRTAVGGMKVKSPNFDIRLSGNIVNIVGRGFGHRVGMSQYGAKQFAEQGLDYRYILSYFYPGTRCVRLYR